MSRLPSEFDYDEKELAELWGSLTNRFPVDKQLLKDLRNEYKDQEGLVLLTRKAISNLVVESFEKQLEKKAKQLFELTNPVTKEHNYTRKSMRIGQGEYLELLYMKINNDTSFSNVLIDVLSEPLMQYVNELEVQYGSILSDSINTLKKSIQNWREEIPPPRSRDVDYQFIPIKEIRAPLHEKKDVFIEKLQEIAITRGYLENLPDDIYSGPDDIFKEFQAGWEKKLEENLSRGLDFEVYVEGDKLSFKLYTGAFSQIDRVKLEELYQINEFFMDPILKKYCYYPYKEDLEEEWKRLENHHKRFTYIIEKTGIITLGIQIDIGKYYAVIKSGKKFEIITNQRFMDEVDEKLVKHQEEIFQDLKHYEAEETKDLIQKVMEKGDEADYRLVSQLFSIGNVRQNMNVVAWKGKEMIEDVIAKYPIISYNVPDTIAPLLTLGLKQHDLFDMIQNSRVEN